MDRPILYIPSKFSVADFVLDELREKLTHIEFDDNTPRMTSTEILVRLKQKEVNNGAKGRE